ncbi:MAG TPA: hypothetical protein VGB26_02400 [Nitrospiria bacterium]|jgi:hypothetical protein
MIKEILPGVFHWVTFHEEIEEDVHSYYFCTTDPAVLIDPRVPNEEMAWFKNQNPPKHIFLTNRLHYRNSNRFIASFGAKVWCHSTGLHEFSKKQKVHGFNHGVRLPGDVLALEVGVLCPEETAFYFPQSGGILAIGDALVRYDGELGFVPDALMGENPKAVKKGLHHIFFKHLEREFDHLLFAHGEPWIGGAKLGLRRFLEAFQE